MPLPCRLRIARSALMLTAAAALTVPLNARESRSSLDAYDLEPPTRVDEALIFSGNPVILTGHSDRSGNRQWIQLETDSCGTLSGIEDGRSVVNRTALEDGDMDDFDDEDPAELGREMIGRWLSEHPEIAVVNDGVDKECDDDDWFDEEDPSDFIASLPNRGARDERVAIA